VIPAEPRKTDFAGGQKINFQAMYRDKVKVAWRLGGFLLLAVPMN
jgi:hypothetical protein